MPKDLGLPRTGHHGGVRFLARLNLGQRVLIVIALGILSYLLGLWISYLAERPYGWIAYAPLSGTPAVPGGRLTEGWLILVWAVLTLIWGVLSLVVLRSSTPPDDRTDTESQRS